MTDFSRIESTNSGRSKTTNYGQTEKAIAFSLGCLKLVYANASAKESE